ERDKAFSIYEVPLSLVDNKLDELIVEKLHLPARPLDVADWQEILQRIKHPGREVTIAVVGKYIKHHDAYKSVYEALGHAGIALNAKVHLRKVESEDVERLGAEQTLAGIDGLLVPGGFGYRGIPGKAAAIRYARERKIPFFGICLGLQCAVIEFARQVLGLRDANSTEFDRNCADPVVCLLDEQHEVTNMGGTMRLGAYVQRLTEGSLAHASYGEIEVSERHRHRYEFNNGYRDAFARAGMVVTGSSHDGALVEVIELREHPWFLAVQCHPEFKSKPTAAHPLFREFVRAGLDRKECKKAMAAAPRLKSEAVAAE
ncbi:MAG TPA: CTP synthase, partial [Gemmataceae bacterium]|nr:CTP synthase [Gemmataceae bacterium]